MLAAVAARPEAATRASARDEEAVRDARWRASVYRGNTDVPPGTGWEAVSMAHDAWHMWVWRVQEAPGVTSGCCQVIGCVGERPGCAVSPLL